MAVYHPLYTSLLLFSVLTAGSSFSQTVFTPVTGFVKLGNTTDGEDAVAANTDVYLSIPLETEVEFSGTVASTTATSITFANSPGWSIGDATTPAEWEPNPTPYCAIITSGAENGIRCIVSTNTADTLTVTTSTPGDLTNVAVGDEVVIRECWTLETFFADSNLPNNTQVLLRDQTLTGINQLANISYLIFDGDWFDEDFTPSNNVILHPGETFVLRSSGAISSLATIGDVSTSSLRNNLVKDNPTQDEDLFIASMSPVPALANSLNLPVADNDQLLIYDGTTGINRLSSATFLYFGGDWFDDSFTNVNSSLTINPGTGYVIRRAASSPASAEWTEPAP